MIAKFRSRISVIRNKSACEFCRVEYIDDMLAFLREIKAYCRRNLIECDILTYFKYEDKPELPDLKQCQQCGRKSFEPLLLSVEELKTSDLEEILQELLRTDYGMSTREVAEILQICTDATIRQCRATNLEFAEAAVQCEKVDSDNFKERLELELGMKESSNQALLSAVRVLVENEKALERQDAAVIVLQNQLEESECRIEEENSTLENYKTELRKVQHLKSLSDKVESLENRLDQANSVIMKLENETNNGLRRTTLNEYRLFDPYSSSGSGNSFKHNFYELSGSELRKTRKTKMASTTDKEYPLEEQTILVDCENDLKQAISEVERHKLHIERLEVELNSLKRFRNERPKLKHNILAQLTHIETLEHSRRVTAAATNNLTREVELWESGMQDLMMEICSLHRELAGRVCEGYTIDKERYHNIYEECAVNLSPATMLSYLARQLEYLQSAEFVTEFMTDYSDSWDDNRGAICTKFNSSTEIYIYWLLHDRKVLEVEEKHSYRFSLEWDFGQSGAVRLSIACAILLLVYGRFYQDEFGAVEFSK